MATVKLNNKKDIREFFKILAEESVKEAKDSLFGDKGAQSLMQQVKKDEKAFKTIVEEEVAEEEVEEEVVEDEAEDVTSFEEEEVDTQPARGIEDVSLDAIQKLIMQLRSAPSVKDSGVEQRLSDYLKFLSKEERVALLAFVEALSKLMTGEVQADAAPDPSEPPYNVTMNQAGSGEDDEVEEEEVDSAEENTPIQVGSVQESASIEKIRNKVIELLGRS